MFKLFSQKLGVLLLAFFISFTFSSCEDKSYFKQIYDKKLYNEPIRCLNLELNPYNQDIYDFIKTLYKFNTNCKTSLILRYKTNIACNSPYSTNPNIKGFIEMSLAKDDKTYYTLYKDLNSNFDFYQEIEQIFKELQSSSKF